MKKLKEAYGSKGFEIVGIATDSPEKLGKFFETKGSLPWLNIVDPRGAIASQQSINAYPTYFLINKEGKHIATPRDKNEMNELIAKELGVEPIPLK